MATERIGEPGGGAGESSDWTGFIHSTTISYLTAVCGPVPNRCELDVMDMDHELGSYPVVALHYPDGYAKPDEYVGRCTAALERLNEHVSWDELEPSALEEEFDECGPRFPDQADLWNAQRFAQALLNGVFSRDDVPEALRAAVAPLQTALERLELAPKGLDMYAEIAFHEGPRRMRWSISLSDTNFDVSLSPEENGDAPSKQPICDYWADTDGNEDFHNDREREYEISDDEETIQVILSNIDQIIIIDRLTGNSLEYPFNRVPAPAQSDGQTSLPI